MAYMGLNHPALLETFFAAGSIGAAAVLVKPRLRQAEVEYILGDCGATTVVFGQDQRENAAGLEAELTGVRSWVSMDGGGPGEEYERFLASGSEELVDEPVEQDDLALIMYTSGTTGRPEGATLTHQTTSSTSTSTP